MGGEEETPARVARRILAVGAGKGGGGKSLIAANLGIYLATIGKRVVLVDADFAGANLHVFVGVERPRLTLASLLERGGQVQDAVMDTPITGLGLISAESGPGWIVNPQPVDTQRLMSALGQLDVDVVVVDLGPGAGVSAVDCFNLADVGLVVTVPEPASVENTYRFLKCAFLRRLERLGSPAIAALIEHAARDASSLPAPRELIAAATADGDVALAATLADELAQFRPRVIVNQARTRTDEELPAAMSSACRRRLGIALAPLGHLELDDAVWLSVRRRRPLLVEHPDSLAAKGFERLTRRLLALDAGEPTPPPDHGPDELTHYEILDVEPSASEEELRRAYRRVRETYGEGSLVVAGLLGKEHLVELHTRLDEAYETLMDDAARRLYDQHLFPEGLPVPRTRRSGTGSLFSDDNHTPVEATKRLPMMSATPPPELTPPPSVGPPLGPDTVYSGALLRELREARAIDLAAIANRTKIGIGHLRALEDERYDLLPAAVYLRGFLTEYARCLRLDGPRVVESYLKRRVANIPPTDEERG